MFCRQNSKFVYPIIEDDSKIVGGEEVKPNSIPYQVVLRVIELIFELKTVFE